MCRAFTHLHGVYAHKYIYTVHPHRHTNTDNTLINACLCIQTHVHMQTLACRYRHTRMNTHSQACWVVTLMGMAAHTCPYNSTLGRDSGGPSR